MDKVTYTGGRKPKGLNKIDKMAKVTNTGGEMSPFGFLPPVLVTLAILSILLSPLPQKNTGV
jgi:hypothetical protein